MERATEVKKIAMLGGQGMGRIFDWFNAAFWLEAKGSGEGMDIRYKSAFCMY